jgi:DNA-binding transcriptional LysR family regulator
MEPDRWLGVEIRHLAALRAVAETGSFGRAAEQLGYTQSAVSQQIAALERAVGAQLVERPGGPRPISITEAGTVLLRHADGIVARLRAAQADLAALSAGDAGTLHVGTYQSVGSRVLPEVISRFSQEHPAVSIQVTEAEDDRLLHGVEAGEIDLTFVQPPLAAGPFEMVELLQDPWVLVVAADSPLARTTHAPALREIASLPLIGYRTCASIQHIENHFGLRGYQANVVFRSDDNGTMQAMVAAGVGAALMPLLAVDLADPRTSTVPLDGKLPPRIVGIAWHRDRVRLPAADRFVELAATVCADLQNTTPAALAG